MARRPRSITLDGLVRPGSSISSTCSSSRDLSRRRCRCRRPRARSGHRGGVLRRAAKAAPPSDDVCAANADARFTTCPAILCDHAGARFARVREGRLGVPTGSVVVFQPHDDRLAHAIRLDPTIDDRIVSDRARSTSIRLRRHVCQRHDRARGRRSSNCRAVFEGLSDDLGPVDADERGALGATRQVA